MPNPEGYVESAEEKFNREYPEGSLKRQEFEREQERRQAETAVPEEVWRGNGESR